MAAVYTTVGKALMVDILDGTTSVPTFYIAWGTGSGTAAVGDTTLFTEASEARVVATVTQPATNTLMFTGSLTANANKTITNAGVFDASSGGTLILKSSGFSLMILVSGQTMTFRFTLPQV